MSNLSLFPKPRADNPRVGVSGCGGGGHARTSGTGLTVGQTTVDTSGGASVKEAIIEDKGNKGKGPLGCCRLQLALRGADQGERTAVISSRRESTARAAISGRTISTNLLDQYYVRKSLLSNNMYM